MWTIGVGVDDIPKEDVTDFLATVGSLIIGWSGVELALGHLYCMATGAHGRMITPFFESIEAAYFAINSFEGRLAMNNAAMVRMHRVRDGALITDWNVLADKINRKWRSRSLVAHSGMFGSCEKKRGRQIWLSPAPHVSSAVRRKNGKAQQFYKSDLEGLKKDFNSLHAEIEKFSLRCFSAMTPTKSESPKRHPPRPSHT